MPGCSRSGPWDHARQFPLGCRRPHAPRQPVAEWRVRQLPELYLASPQLRSGPAAVAKSLLVAFAFPFSPRACLGSPRDLFNQNSFYAFTNFCHCTGYTAGVVIFLVTSRVNGLPTLSCTVSWNTIESPVIFTT